MRKENNLELIKNSIKEIERFNGDPEMAHSDEDKLREEVLKDIASGEYNIEECIIFAKEVLKTSEIEFQRWYA